MESVDRIKETGLKLTPQRKIIYEIMMKLGHATVEDITSLAHSEGNEMTVSTVYRILDSFCNAGLLSRISGPESGKCYYDITTHEHSHVFYGHKIVDYDDSALTGMIREYLQDKGDIPGEISRIQIQITVNS